jgi:hypothetical protein
MNTAGYTMKLNKYFPFAAIYFFINSLALPFGLTFTALLALRAEYHRSFGFVIGCLPALVRLHLHTARDNTFPPTPVQTL